MSQRGRSLRGYQLSYRGDRLLQVVFRCKRGCYVFSHTRNPPQTKLAKVWFTNNNLKKKALCKKQASSFSPAMERGQNIERKKVIFLVSAPFSLTAEVKGSTKLPCIPEFPTVEGKIPGVPPPEFPPLPIETLSCPDWK